MKFKISVPATSANLGPGFDTAGLALNLYNEFDFDFTQKGIHFFDEKHDFETSLVLDTFFKVLDTKGIARPLNVNLVTHTNIPIARGLGSSSTCIVAGVMAANLFGDLNLTQKNIATIATKIEGHPDNVVPAVFGNLNLSLYEKELFVQTTQIHKDLSFIGIVPNYMVKTEDARNALPQTYKIKDVVYSMARTAFLQDAFKTKNLELLKEVSKDTLHQPFRKSLIKDYEKIQETVDKSGAVSYWISGAGPTILVLVESKNKEKVLKHLRESLDESNDLLDLQIDIKGAMIK